MKLHWSPRSPFVRKVMVVAHELGIAGRFETVRTRVAMTAANPALMADNPLSKIPSLVLDDQSVLYDSRVIGEYFADLAGDTRLFPAEPAARRLAMRRQALGDGLLDFMILWRNERERPAPQQSPLYIEAYRAKYVATIQSLDREAASLPSEPTIGEIAIGVALSYLDFRFVDLDWRKGHDAIAAWHGVFARRPSMIATGPVDI